MCILNQCFIVRRPYAAETKIFPEHALMHFIAFLSRSLEQFPRYHLDLSKYFTEDYGA